MKRIYREMDDTTKMRISQRLKNRTLSDSHKQAIADSMRKYWETVPSKPQEKNNDSSNHKQDETSM